MKVLLIDDEQPAIDELTYLLGKYPDLQISAAFTHPVRALEAMADIKPDVVFLDIDMPYIDGLKVALQIQALYAGIMIVFVTAFSKYALDSFKAYPLDYLLKPVKEARLDSAIEQIRKQYGLMHSHRNMESALFIKCFGKFEMQAPGGFKWGTRRVRDLFMYLLDRCGAAPSRSELVHSVFGGLDDKKTANNIYVTVYKLRSLLDSLDPERRLVRLDEDYSLKVSAGVCDYIDFINFARQNATITARNAVAAARAWSLCSGIYLEDVDADWALDTSAIVEGEYERIGLGLARFHYAAGRDREAENILTSLLSRNPLSEDGHSALLDLYMKNGNHQAYAARYLEYVRILKKELDEKPSPEYTRHYNSIQEK